MDHLIKDLSWVSRDVGVEQILVNLKILLVQIDVIVVRDEINLLCFPENGDSIEISLWQ